MPQKARSQLVPAVPGLAALLVSCATAAADGRLEVRILDEQGDLTPARAWVDVRGDRLFQPDEPDTATPYRRDSSFSCDGTFIMRVPVGQASVHIEKGKEYLPQDVSVEILEGATTTQTVKLRRWIDMPATGWYSADLHVHLGSDDPRILKQLSLADDVHLIPSFTYWLRGKGEVWQAEWPDQTFVQPVVVDDRHVITRNNLEIERISGRAAPGATVGATFLYNLNHPVTARRNGEHFPTDAELCRVARQHSPKAVFDSDKPSWSETVVGAALGMLDTIQVCHNHYNRGNTVPGGWGMIGPLAAGESNAAAGDGLFHRTNALYYRFLNCGFRLGVSGGSAIGVMRVPTGYNLVYAQIDGPLTADRMWASIRAGRTFATSGPMLMLTVNGSTVGDTVSLTSEQSSTVSIRTNVRAAVPLESLEIVHDGRIVASRSLSDEPADPAVDATLEYDLSVERSGWVASRALYRTSHGLLRQAHTSPVYLTVDQKPTASAEDARYMLRWIDQLAAIAQSHTDHFPDDDARQSVLSIYAEARGRYEDVIETAEQEWGD